MTTDPEETGKKKAVWYKTWWGVLIVIFFILPFFLIWQIWAKTKWGNVAKVIVTLLIIGFYTMVFAAGGSGTQTKTTDDKKATTVEATKTLTPEEQAKKDADDAAEKKQADDEKAQKEAADALAKKQADEAKAKQEAEAKAQAEAKAEAEKELDAEVRFSDVAFRIKNKEAKDWANCKFVLNGKVFGSDYTYKTTAGIVANDSIIVAMREFTKGDGTRFDPYSTKAKNLFLSCDVGANHRTGYYTISE